MATLPATAISCSILNSSATSRRRGATCVRELNSFGGLKANNKRMSFVGAPTGAEQSFAMVVSSKGKKRRGRALASTGSAAEEIFKIAAIMNGLVLVGVAVGFVLLRVETALEEAEAAE